jgi:uncharacterized membrane protein
MAYYFIKYLHIIFGSLLLGSSFASALNYKNGNLRLSRYLLIFSVLQFITGIWLMFTANFYWLDSWLIISIISLLFLIISYSLLSFGLINLSAGRARKLMLVNIAVIVITIALMNYKPEFD